MADACCSSKRDTIAELGRKAEQRRVLIIVMLINLAMFVVEFGGGVVARSSALMADSVDMFGDAVVYALSLYALHRGARWEAGAALAKGGIILARSEEHTSELQSLMRNSYAVFCLKKNTQYNHQIMHTSRV